MDAHVFSTNDDVRGSGHFVDPPDSGFFIVSLLPIPWESTQEVCVVVSGVVIAPIHDVFHGSSARNGRLESSSLRNEPVGQEATVAVAADGEMRGVGDVVLHQSIESLQNVAARLG